ncbi:2-oxo acid dehydrogenase subunit E2 [Pseudonocardia lutea]|uniref:2-oxo acid dehydrogenase subunit E2 n=1 Tax=Pseudonocardia lutea TaxID=2172015 RepID=A0ABW1IE28_9PSEU
MSAPVAAEPTTDVVPEGYADVPHTRVRLKARRRAIARNLEAAARIPSLTADVQMDMTALLAARSEWNAGHPEAKLSVLAFLMRAAVAALRVHPDLNASYTETAMLQWSTVNLGVAVDSPGGLVVPVVRAAERLGVAELGVAVKDLAERVRGRGLTGEDLVGGTFTVSNPGAVGPSLRAEALLNPPQVGLLGLPGLRRVPIVVGAGAEERVEIRSVLCPSLTFDHRALDGGEAIRYLTTLTAAVESWSLSDYLVPAHRPDEETP